jgi:hypothetical protein
MSTWDAAKVTEVLHAYDDIVRQAIADGTQAIQEAMDEKVEDLVSDKNPVQAP